MRYCDPKWSDIWNELQIRDVSREINWKTN